MPRNKGDFRLLSESALGLPFSPSCAAGPGGKLGRIAMTGVQPAYRGQGLSRPTVVAGMRWLASQGVDVIELEMDLSNLSAARVYESLGFEKVADTVWFELRLDD